MEVSGEMVTAIDIKVRAPGGRWHTLRADLRADTALCVVSDKEWNPTDLMAAIIEGGPLESSLGNRRFTITRLLRVAAVPGRTEIWLQAVRE